MKIKSIFLDWKFDEVIHEEDDYNFIIPNNTVLIIDKKEYAISRTNFDLQENTVYYLVRPKGSSSL